MKKRRALLIRTTQRCKNCSSNSLSNACDRCEAKRSTPSAVTTPGQDPSTVKEALAKVQFLQDSKPNTNALLAFGLLFFFAVPMVLFIGTDADIIFDDGIFVCCFSIILGIVLMLLAKQGRTNGKNLSGSPRRKRFD